MRLKREENLYYAFMSGVFEENKYFLFLQKNVSELIFRILHANIM